MGGIIHLQTTTTTAFPHGQTASAFQSKWTSQLLPPTTHLPLPIPKQPHSSASTSPILLPSPPPPSSPLLPFQSLHGHTKPHLSPVNLHALYHSLRLSVKLSRVDLARATHAFFLKLFQDDTYLGNSVISTYIRLGLLHDAYEVFVDLPNPDVASFSTLISGLGKSNLETEAVELFFMMRSLSIHPNEYTFVAILTACVRVLDFELGSQVHALGIKLGYLGCVFVANALMGFYGKCGCLDFVIQLFDEMPQRDIASWNTLISCFVKEGLYEEAFESFRNLGRVDAMRMDQFTLSTGLAACSGSLSAMEGREIHARAIRTGLESGLSVRNALIGFYTKCGSMKEVVSLFERMEERDAITWTEMINGYMEFGMVDSAVELFERMQDRNCISYNAMLAGFCRNGVGWKALELFQEMVREGRELTDFSLTSVINACGLTMNLELSWQVHGFVIKFGVDSNVCIETALLDMCTKCGRMEDAETMFENWPLEEDGLMVQTSMLCGYARNGLPDEAISLFLQSHLEETLVVDEVALASVLGVCGTLGICDMGKQIHCQVIKTGFLADLGVGNSVISMYSKCCSMEDAIKSFDSMLARDIVSWNCLIAGHLLHRQGDEALSVWSRMEKTGIRPDAITFVLVVSAYKHTRSKLVEECQTLFHLMKRLYDIDPTSDHYAALVSVLGFWGLLKEAEEVTVKMPFEPDAPVWRALLDSCRLHRDAIIGKRVVKRILAMEPQDPSMFVLVSNLYSASARWHCSDMIRENMKIKGLRKHPCRSWVVDHDKIHSFYVRDKSHPQAKDICAGLEILVLECLKTGYEPDTSFVLHELEEHQKKDFLFYHSAKIAATYGILTTKPGKPVRIVKNILLCADCHSFLKHVSTVTRREIVLRDTSGFHFFSNGQCLCRDCW